MRWQWPESFRCWYQPKYCHFWWIDSRYRKIMKPPDSKVVKLLGVFLNFWPRIPSWTLCWRKQWWWRQWIHQFRVIFFASSPIFLTTRPAPRSSWYESASTPKMWMVQNGATCGPWVWETGGQLERELRIRTWSMMNDFVFTWHPGWEKSSFCEPTMRSGSWWISYVPMPTKTSPLKYQITGFSCKHVTVD